MTKDHDPLHNLIMIGRCPVTWEEMSGSDSLRTCITCGALVFNQEAAGTDDFNNRIEKFKGSRHARLFRRTDGKIMVARCGLQPDWAQTRIAIIVPTVVSLLFACLELMRFGFLAYPYPEVWITLFLWNVVAALILAHFRIRRNWKLKAVVWVIGVGPMIVQEVIWLMWLVMMFTTGPT
jgi:hypothetical protein